MGKDTDLIAVCRATVEYKEMFENLTATQARCTELVNAMRKMTTDEGVEVERLEAHVAQLSAENDALRATCAELRELLDSGPVSS